mmetsp:Transcript_29008/g.71230  ORF Transcript_29008/g.71230 Transcript_29008/m.71230 type:complete len:89 (+) Transcript_29008:111-377(+)
MSAIDLTVLESDFDASQGTVSHRFLSDWSPQPMTSTIDADVEEASMWKGAGRFIRPLSYPTSPGLLSSCVSRRSNRCVKRQPAWDPCH